MTSMPAARPIRHRPNASFSKWSRLVTLGLLFLVGLATDYCVHYSALDARRLGFDTVVIEPACRAIDLAGSLDAAWSAMQQAGVQRMSDLG